MLSFSSYKEKSSLNICFTFLFLLITMFICKLGLCMLSSMFITSMLRILSAPLILPSPLCSFSWHTNLYVLHKQSSLGSGIRCLTSERYQQDTEFGWRQGVVFISSAVSLVGCGSAEAAFLYQSL